MIRSSRAPVLLFFVIALSSPGVTANAETITAGAGALPHNVWVASEVRVMLIDLLQRSPTIRRQCSQIAGAPRVYVIVRATVPRFDGESRRARMTFLPLASGGAIARVEVPLGRHFAELVAHELEHVVEQIEGVNLRVLAMNGAPGVRQVAGGVYETARARSAGETAAWEVVDGPDPVRIAVGRAVGGVVRGAWRILKFSAVRGRVAR